MSYNMVRYLFKLSIIILVVLPFYLLLRRPWKRKMKREWALGCFVLFTVGLLALALEGSYTNPVRMVQEAVRRFSAGERINLVPFRTIGSFFRHFNAEAFLINIIGNIVMFMPWGFGLVLLWKRERKALAIVRNSLALPLFIETVQLFIGRSVDVDDVILNFAGACLGAGIYFLMRKRFPVLEELAEKNS